MLLSRILLLVAGFPTAHLSYWKIPGLSSEYQTLQQQKKHEKSCEQCDLKENLSIKYTTVGDT